MIRRFTASLILLALSVPAFAEEETLRPVIVAECREGGCMCTESALSISEMEILIGAEAPVGMEQLVVVDYYGDGLTWSYATVEELEVMTGGDGTCSTESPPTPEDGVWSSTARFMSLSCGAQSALLRSLMEPSLNDDAAPRVVWRGVFDGAIYQRAWMAANPDAENVAVPFTQTSATVSEGSATYTAEGGSMRNSYRFELLSPRLFRADYYTSTQIDGRPCEWHIRSLVRKVSD